MKPRALYFAVAAMAVLATANGVRAQGALYFVNTTSDTVVAGACATGNPPASCSLRGAIQAANAHPGKDGIEFALASTDPGFNGIFWTINLTGALPEVTILRGFQQSSHL